MTNIEESFPLLYLLEALLLLSCDCRIKLRCLLIIVLVKIDYEGLVLSALFVPWSI